MRKIRTNGLAILAFLILTSCHLGQNLKSNQDLEWSLIVKNEKIEDFDIITNIDALNKESDSSRFTLELLTLQDTIRIKDVPAYGLLYSDLIVLEIANPDEECAMITVAESNLITIRPHTNVSNECSYANKLSFRYKGSVVK